MHPILIRNKINKLETESRVKEIQTIKKSNQTTCELNQTLKY